MNKNEKLTLTVDEMNLVCDSMNDKTHAFSCVNWKDVFIIDLEVANDLNNLEEKYGVKLKAIIQKLKKMPEVEVLLLIQEIMYTVDDFGSNYKSRNMIPPHQKILKILKSQ